MCLFVVHLCRRDAHIDTSVLLLKGKELKNIECKEWTLSEFLKNIANTFPSPPVSVHQYTVTPLHLVRTWAKVKTQSTHQIITEGESCHSNKNMTTGDLQRRRLIEPEVLLPSATANILASNSFVNARWQRWHMGYLSSVQNFNNTHSWILFCFSQPGAKCTPPQVDSLLIALTPPLLSLICDS